MHISVYISEATAWFPELPCTPHVLDHIDRIYHMDGLIFFPPSFPMSIYMHLAVER